MDVRKEGKKEGKKEGRENKKWLRASHVLGMSGLALTC
jgi:hypothetical protein